MAGDTNTASQSKPIMGADKAGAKKSMVEANAAYKKGNYSAALKHYDKERSGLTTSGDKYYFIILTFLQMLSPLTDRP